MISREFFTIDETVAKNGCNRWIMSVDKVVYENDCSMLTDWSKTNFRMFATGNWWQFSGGFIFFGKHPVSLDRICLYWQVKRETLSSTFLAINPLFGNMKREPTFRIEDFLPSSTWLKAREKELIEGNFDFFIPNRMSSVTGNY
jgi:hypothetical protein